MSRVRQFGNLRSSRSTKKQGAGHFVSTSQFGKASSTHSEYMCVNCVNKSLSQQKAELRANRKEHQNNESLYLQRSRQTQAEKLADFRNKKIEEQKKKGAEYNIAVMQHQENKRQKGQSIKAREKQIQEFTTNQYQKNVQEEQRRVKLLKDKWRKDIQHQIQQKNQKIIDQKQQKKQYKDILINPISQKAYEIQREQQQSYRNGLLDQIKLDKEKKEKERKQQRQKADNSFLLLQNAQQRAKQTQQLENLRKERLLEEAKIYQTTQERKRLQRQAKAEQEKIYEKATKEMQQKRSKQLSIKRQQRMNHYLQEIKQQINEKQRKTRENADWQKQIVQSSLLMDRVRIQKPCNSCQKTYPKTFLTKVK